MARFRLSTLLRTYEVECADGTDMDAMWESQKCWFGDMARVLIEDEHGNHRIFPERNEHKEGEPDEDGGRKDRAAHPGDDGIE